MIALSFESWTEKSGGWRRFYLYRVPGLRHLWNMWYRLGGFYLSGWTPLIIRAKR